MANEAIRQINTEISNEAPKSIEEIGDRTFRVKERMWAFNTVANLQYICCKDMLVREGKHKEHKYQYPMHFLDEIKMAENRKEELTKENGANLAADIKSLDDRIAEFKSKQCAECIEKATFRLDKLSDKQSGDALVLASGPSVLDEGKLGEDGKTIEYSLLPKAVTALKRYNGVICVCDRSLIPLLKAGIIPKYVVAADGVDHVEKYFEHELVEKAVKEYGLTAIFNTQVHPNVTKRWVGYGGKIMWYNVALDPLYQSKSLSRYLIHMTNDTVISVPWGQVFGYGYGLCYLMGYSPILCYGFDCGFREEDKIEDTPYWNPYYKATAQEMIWEKLGYTYTFGNVKKCEYCNTVLPTPPYKIWNFNQNDPKFQEQFIEAAKSFPFDIQHEYTTKTPPEMYNQEAKDRTIKTHFHFYSNPFGNKTYHDNIFKAYKDIMLSFFIGNPQTKVIQCSEYTTMFAQTCTVCKGTKKVNKEVEDVKECYKCHVKRIEKSKGEMMDCPRCKKFMGKNEKGEMILESCGIEGNNIQCMGLEDYINSKLVI